MESVRGGPSLRRIFNGTTNVAMVFAVGLGISAVRCKQSNEFESKVREQAVASCNGDAECQQRVLVHFETCFDRNHDSRHMGRYNREHTIDKAGFDSCLRATAMLQRIADRDAEFDARAAEMAADSVPASIDEADEGAWE